MVVSEGFDVGDLGERKDPSATRMFSASETTVAQIVVNYLNAVGPGGHAARRAGNVPGTDQRHSMIYASTVDLDEAYKVGPEGRAQIAAQDGSGCMATILREPGADLQRALRQGAAGAGGQLRAHLPDGVDRRQAAAT